MRESYEKRQAALKKFGANVRRLRVTKSLTQQQVGEIANLDIRTIQKIEAGQINVLTTTLPRLQRALNCDWRDLMDFL